MKYNFKADDVLVELKIETHLYTNFIYDKVFLQRKEPIPFILKEFEILKKQ